MWCWLCSSFWFLACLSSETLKNLMSILGLFWRYQLELCKKAMEENIIVYLGTGCGKTHIAVLLMHEMGHLIRKPEKNICVFLAPTVALVHQVSCFTYCCVQHFLFWILCNVIVLRGIVILCINLMKWYVPVFSNLPLNFSYSWFELVCHSITCLLRPVFYLSIASKGYSRLYWF